MSGDIYQKIEHDFPSCSEAAWAIIEELEAKTKNLVSNAQIRAIIYDAKGDLERLKKNAQKHKYEEIIPNKKDIDFTKSFHELGMLK